MGLDVYLQKNDEGIEIPSKKYPDHLFKIGYFRSSYNESGINSILRPLLEKDLYWIFSVKDETNETDQDWKNNLKRCRQLLKEVRDLKKRKRGFQSIPIYLHKSEASNNAEALNVFMKHLDESRNINSSHLFKSYSSQEGSFYLEEKNPLKVSAIIPGKSFGGSPCIYVIIPIDLTFVIQCLEIVEETIKYVLSQPDPESYSLYFSG